MGVYLRADSPFYWMLLERPGLPSLKRSTRIPHAAADAMSRKLQRHQADEIYRAQMVDLARARYDLPPLVDAGDTLETFAPWYTRNVASHHRGHEREADAVARLIEKLGRHRLTEITPGVAQEYLTTRVQTDRVRASTANREVDVLKTMLRSAVQAGKLKASPLAGMKRLRVVKRKKRVLTVEDEARLLAELPPADQALYIVAVDTLIRLSNVLNLTRAEDKGTHLELLDSKTGPYDVPLSTRARAALDGLPKTGDYYFSHRRGAKNLRDTRGALRRMLARACARCTPPIPYGRAVAGITFHTATRATGATRMLRAGIDPKTVQEIGNWKSLEQMGEYLVTDMTLKRAAVNVIGPPLPRQLRGRKRGRKAS